MIVESKQAIRHIFFFLLWCSWYDQKTGVVFTGSVTFKIKFGHTLISLSRLNIQMLKTACINLSS